MPDKVQPILDRLKALDRELDTSTDPVRIKAIYAELRAFRDELKRLQEEVVGLFAK